MVRFACRGLIVALGLGAAQAVEPASPLLRRWAEGFIPIPDSPGLRMHRLETTQNVYQLVTGVNPSQWPGKDHSVEMVSWDEALAFCKKATLLLQESKLIATTEEVRLPTEREWEHACRAGTTTAYSFGDDATLLTQYGWFDGNAAGNDPPSGAKQPNPWGFYDFHGYAWEWCADATGESRAIRGGSWTSSAAECRSDSRQLVSHGSQRPDLGFRCVLAPASGR